MESFGLLQRFHFKNFAEIYPCCYCIQVKLNCVQYFVENEEQFLEEVGVAWTKLMNIDR